MKYTEKVRIERSELLKHIQAAVLLISIAFFPGCSSSKTARENSQRANQPSAPIPAAAQTEKDPRPVIVALGDSLTAGQGVDPAENYPAKLQARIDASG